MKAVLTINKDKGIEVSSFQELIDALEKINAEDETVLIPLRIEGCPSESSGTKTGTPMQLLEHVRSLPEVLQMGECVNIRD